jgi:hypothetical protein
MIERLVRYRLRCDVCKNVIICEGSGSTEFWTKDFFRDWLHDAKFLKGSDRNFPVVQGKKVMCHYCYRRQRNG